MFFFGEYRLGGRFLGRGSNSLQKCDVKSHRGSITLYWLPEELPGCNQDTAEEEDGGGEPVEQLEPPVINGGLLQAQEAAGGLADGSQQLSHCQLEKSVLKSEAA